MSNTDGRPYETRYHPDRTADPNASAAAFPGAAVHTYKGTRKSKRLMWQLLDIQKGDSIIVMPSGKTFIAKAHVLATYIGDSE